MWNSIDGCNNGSGRERALHEKWTLVNMRCSKAHRTQETLTKHFK